MTPCIQVSTTTPSASVAHKIAKALVAEKLAACVQVSAPIQSHYIWKLELHCDEEYLLTIKTRASLFESVAEQINRLHPYDVPEVIATPLAHISEPYRNWLLSQTIDNKG